MKLPSIYGKGFGCGGALVRRPRGRLQHGAPCFDSADANLSVRLFDQLPAR